LVALRGLRRGEVVVLLVVDGVVVWGRAVEVRGRVRAPD
jgi:hypothetical protein